MRYIISVVLTKDGADGIHRVYDINASNEDEATGIAFRDSKMHYPYYLVASMITMKIDDIGNEGTSE